MTWGDYLPNLPPPPPGISPVEAEWRAHHERFECQGVAGWTTIAETLSVRYDGGYVTHYLHLPETDTWQAMTEKEQHGYDLPTLQPPYTRAGTGAA